MDALKGLILELFRRLAQERGQRSARLDRLGKPFCRNRGGAADFFPEIAAAWGVEKGQTYVLIHSGSRGFGHQICQDTLNAFIKQGFA